MTDAKSAAERLLESREFCTGWPHPTTNPIRFSFVTADVFAVANRCLELEAESAKLRRDAERFRYIREHMTNANSLHMDGTAYYRLRSPRARAKSFDDAVDAEMKGGDS